MSERIDVERVGGFAGFGGPGSPLKSRGSVTIDTLSAIDRHAVDILLRGAGKAEATLPDEFRYRITRGARTVEVREAQVPTVLRECVKDELA